MSRIFQECLSFTKKKIEHFSEVLLLFRKLVQTGLTIETGNKSFCTGDGSLILTFVISELVDSNNSMIQSVFTEFLYDIETMKEYGMPCYTDLSSGESGTKISYMIDFWIFPLSTIWGAYQNHGLQGFDAVVE